MATSRTTASPTSWQASVALLPLPDEPVARLFTSPLKLFDYMAAGVPIVASDLPALREVLRHEQNALLATPGDPDSFAAAVQRILADPRWQPASVRRPARTSIAIAGTPAPSTAGLPRRDAPASASTTPAVRASAR